MDTPLENLVIVFCFVGALFLFILSLQAEAREERRMQERLHPKGKRNLWRGPANTGSMGTCPVTRSSSYNSFK